MSKRARPTKKKKDLATEAVELPGDLWFLIGSYITWHDIESLYHFLGVCRNAIHYIQKSIKVLMGKLLNPRDTEEQELRDSLSRRFTSCDSPVIHRLDECIKYYCGLALDDKTTSMEEWREWDITLLYTLQISQLYERYCTKRTVDRYTIIKYIERIRSPAPSSPVSHIVYMSGKDIVPLHTLTNVRIVEGMSSVNEADVRRIITEKRTEREREAYLSMIDHAKANGKRAAYYYALYNEVKVRKATEKDLFKDVVIERPGSTYLHIYSEYSPSVKEFFGKCVIYEGKQKDMLLALYLHTHEVIHQNICLARCKQILASHTKKKIVKTVLFVM